MRAGQHVFEGVEDHDTLLQTAFYVCGDVLSHLSGVFEPLQDAKLAQEMASLLRGALEPTQDPVLLHFAQEKLRVLEV